MPNDPQPRMDHRRFPVEGMTCAACALRVEKSLNAVPGVRASVNFADESASVDYDPAITSSEAIVKAVEKAGYRVPRSEAVLALSGMTCAACATRIEAVLNKLPGVTASVNLATERALVHYDPGLARIEDLIGSVRKAGYDAHELTDATREAEQQRQAQHYRHELRMFIISALLTLPLLAQMIPMLWGSTC
jgi:Cu+-exporting ATPase